MSRVDSTGPVNSGVWWSWLVLEMSSFTPLPSLLTAPWLQRRQSEKPRLCQIGPYTMYFLSKSIFRFQLYTWIPVPLVHVLYKDPTAKRYVVSTDALSLAGADTTVIERWYWVCRRRCCLHSDRKIQNSPEKQARGCWHSIPVTQHVVSVSPCPTSYYDITHNQQSWHCSDWCILPCSIRFSLSHFLWNNSQSAA